MTDGHAELTMRVVDKAGLILAELRPLAIGDCGPERTSQLGSPAWNFDCWVEQADQGAPAWSERWSSCRRSEDREALLDPFPSPFNHGLPNQGCDSRRWVTCQPDLHTSLRDKR